ncbi:MAG: DUF4139 domain-containing protein, partial [Desulfopila sp.]|nr:DUF4139 domain-containing protein [Desulfopila sp.]
MNGKIIVALIVSLAVCAGSAAAERVIIGEDGQTIGLTVYNTNLAMVRDSRLISLPVGEHVVEFKGVSPRIKAETASLRGEKIEVLEQSYDVDILTPDSLLENFVGRKVTIVRVNPASGEESEVQARIVSTAGGTVFQIGDHFETNIAGRIRYPELPGNLRNTPALSMLVANTFPENQEVELSYLTEGLEWQVDYVAELHESEDRIDVKGWVTLTNNSGTSYSNARLQLVAGEVNKVHEGRTMMPMALADSAETMMARGKEQVRQESFAAYHLYSLDRPTNLADNQVKQIALLQEDDGICRKELLLRSVNQSYYWAKVGKISSEESVEAAIVIQNSRESGFGLPKPAGTVRVYRRDSGGFSQFVGEDSIGHIPEDGEIRIRLGRSFDVTADRVQTDFSVSRGLDGKSRIHESAYAVSLHNAQEHDVEVIVEENLPGDWEILSESLPHHKKSAAT